jgi:hypothetical protein
LDRKPEKDAQVVRVQALLGQETRKRSSSCPTSGLARIKKPKKKLKLSKLRSCLDKKTEKRSSSCPSSGLDRTESPKKKLKLSDFSPCSDKKPENEVQGVRVPYMCKRGKYSCHFLVAFSFCGKEGV